MPSVVELRGQSINLDSVIHVQWMEEVKDTQTGRFYGQDIVDHEVYDVTEEREVRVTMDETKIVLVRVEGILLVRMTMGHQWPLRGRDIEKFLYVWRRYRSKYDYEYEGESDGQHATHLSRWEDESIARDTSSGSQA